MKLKYFVLFLVLVVVFMVGNLCKGGEKDLIFEDGFVDVVEIEKWSRLSLFGGGGI